MSIYTTIKQLASLKHISIAEVERATGMSNGSLAKWDKHSPKVENVQMIADFFHVSTDELLGRHASTAVQLSDDALNIAAQFDAATEKTKALVRLALDVEPS